MGIVKGESDTSRLNVALKNSGTISNSVENLTVVSMKLSVNYDNWLE